MLRTCSVLVVTALERVFSENGLTGIFEICIESIQDGYFSQQNDL